MQKYNLYDDLVKHQELKNYLTSMIKNLWIFSYILTIINNNAESHEIFVSLFFHLPLS